MCKEMSCGSVRTVMLIYIISHYRKTQVLLVGLFDDISKDWFNRYSNLDLRGKPSVLI